MTLTFEFFLSNFFRASYFTDIYNGHRNLTGSFTEHSFEGYCAVLTSYVSMILNGNRQRSIAEQHQYPLILNSYTILKLMSRGIHFSIIYQVGLLTTHVYAIVRSCRMLIRNSRMYASRSKIIDTNRYGHSDLTRKCLKRHLSSIRC
jgi:hypothetical protein